MKLIFTLFIFMTALAHGATFTFEQILDDTGRAFNPGDYITMNMNQVHVQRVEMDCKGYRGAVATLYVDGYAYDSKRLTTWRQNYVWNVPNVLGSQVEIRFTDIDPIVYSTRVTYEAPVEVVIETQIEYVEVEVAKRNLYNVGLDIRSSLDFLYERLKFINNYEIFLDEGLRLVEEVVYAGSNSPDSDASVITQKFAVNLIDTLDCKNSRRVLRTIAKQDSELKLVIRKMRTNLSLMREHLDYHTNQCSEFSASF